MDLVNKIDRLYSACYTGRANFHSRWQDISDSAMARRDFLSQQQWQGRSRQKRIYSTVFQEAHNNYIAALQALMVPEGANWEAVYPGDARLLDRIYARRHFDELSHIQMWAYNNPQGGFYRAVGQAFYDYAAFGNGCIFEDWDEDFGCPRWIYWPLQETFFLTNAQGNVIGYVRRFCYTASQAVGEFGPDRVAEGVRLEAERNPDQGAGAAQYEYLQVIHPSDQGLFLGVRTEGGHPWISVVMGRKEKALVKEIEGFWEQPVFALRHLVDPGEDYGRGPGDRAIPDQRTASLMFKDMLDASQLSLRPPVMVPERGLLSPVRMQPAGQTIYRPSMFGSGQPPVFPLTDAMPKGTFSIEMFQLVINQIRQAFLWDLLQPFDQRYMSATQILELAARTTQLLGPNFSSLRCDWLQPQAQRTFNLNKRHGKHPRTPAGLEGVDVHVIHSSPAMLAQRAPEVNSIVAWGQLVIELASKTQNVDILDVANFDELLYSAAEALQIPAKAQTARSEVKARREAKNDAAEMQNEMQQFATVAEAAGKAAPALKAIQGGPAA